MKKLILLAAWLLTSSLAFADGIPPEFEGSTEDTPVDGGLSLLVAAAIGYGSRKAIRAAKAKH